MAGRAPVRHPPRTRPGARDPSRHRAGRDGAGADRPCRARPHQPHHPRRVGPGPRGPSPGLPTLVRRRRALGPARPRRHHRRGHRAAHRPMPLLRCGLAARRRGVRVRADGRAGGGTRRRTGVPPPDLAAPRRCPDRRRAARRPRPLHRPHLLRRPDLPRRPLAARHRQRRHRSSRQRLDRRARPPHPGPDPGAHPGRRRPVRPMGRPRRKPLPAHHRGGTAVAPRRHRADPSRPCALARAGRGGSGGGAGRGPLAAAGRHHRPGRRPAGARPQPPRRRRAGPPRTRRHPAPHRPTAWAGLVDGPDHRRPRHPRAQRPTLDRLDRPGHPRPRPPVRPRRR